jgi:hypothetical protein
MLDPIKMLELKVKEDDSKRKQMTSLAKIASDRQRDKDKEDIELLKLAQSAMVHPESNVVGLETARVGKGLVQ